MPALTFAPTRALPPLRGFAVTLRTAGHTLALPVIARSSGDDAELALSHCPDDAPFGLVVKPLGPRPGSPSAKAMRIYRLKLALADLVE